MIISRIMIENVLGLQYAEIDPSAAKVHMIGGQNAAGKTAICDGIRYALLGEPARVKLKREYKYIVKDGEKSGTVAASFTLGAQAYSVHRRLPDGKTTVYRGEEEVAHMPELPEALPFVIDAHLFADLPNDKRKAFLWSLMGVRVGRDDIARRMDERGCKGDFVVEVMPLLRADTGFEDAVRYAAAKMSEARGAWKGITGGETYGSKKAETWRPVVEEVPEGKIEELSHEIDKLGLQVVDKRRELIAVRAAESALECPHCHKLTRYVRRENQSGYILEPFISGKQGRDPQELSDEIQKLEFNRSLVSDQLAALETKLRARANADEVVARALEAHKDVQAWGKIVEVMGPSGIPGELLGKVLGPLNDILRVSAQDTGWQQVRIALHMGISADGRLYQLLSESERWRVDVQLAHAISTHAGLGLLIIDRLDLLQKSSRGKTLAWLNSLDYRLVIVMGTMEAEVTGLNNGVMFHYLADGRLQ